MASALEICRICLNTNVKMYTLKKTNIENLYKLLTQDYLDIEDDKPATVCFLCYAKLRQCERLQQQAIKSNELLEQLLKGGLMHATANAILSSYNTSQDLQISSIYHLDLEPATSKDVFLVPIVEADSLISVKEEVEEAIDEGNNVTDLKPVTCEDSFLHPKYEVNSPTSVKEEIEAVDEGYNVTENLCIIQLVKEVKHDPHLFNSTQIQQKDKTSNINEEEKGIYMKSERNMENKNTFLRNKEKCKKFINNDVYAGVDIKLERKLGKVVKNVLPNKQKISKARHNEDTQKIHIKDIHITNTIIDEYQCNECGEQFSTKHTLIDHILNCMKTAETSVSESQVTKADTVKSLPSEMYSCDICEYKTYNKLSIETHWKMHSVTKILSCHICGYMCALEGNLKKHMKKHTAEEPFSCNICEYRCLHRGNLKQHMRTHTGEKPYSCNICEYRCAKNTDLKRHMRTHTGEKPFSCYICEYRCAYKHLLKRHILTHRQETLLL